MNFKSLIVTTALVIGAFAPAYGQDAKAQREAEVKRLEAMLKKVDAALKELKPLAYPKFEFRQYDVRQLFYQVYNQSAPHLRIPSESAGRQTSKGGTLVLGEEESEEEGVINTDQLVEMVRSSTGEELWDDPASIEVHGGYLLVFQTPVIHGKLSRFIETLRKTVMRSVQMEVGFYVLSKDVKEAMEQAALESKGILSAKLLKRLDASVVGKKSKLIGSAVLTALNEQRVYLHQGREQSYVENFEQSSGGTGNKVETVAVPLVKVLRTGMALDMRGTILERGGRDNPSIALDVKFLQAQPAALKKRKTPWGIMDMPRLTTDSVRTSARVPSGAGMLVFSSQRQSLGKDSNLQEVTVVVRPRVLKR